MSTPAIRSMRVVRRQAIEQSIAELLSRVTRFEHRARSAADRLWAARAGDVLRDLLPPPEPAHGEPRSVWESEAHVDDGGTRG